VRRGYLCALYAGSDSRDDADALAQVYPEYDFALLARRVWAGQRALDYLETLPEVDKNRIGLTGHSRDGKQAIIEAAFDERITAVIPSSPGDGGTVPFRLYSEKYAGESVEWLTRVFPTWFNPKLRFFVGREQSLPVDANLLVALVAPRSCLLSAGLPDWVDSVWSLEQCYRSARKVYELYNRPERLAIRWRDDTHSLHARDIEDYLDWFDIQFGRSKRQFQTELLYGYDFDEWRRQTGETVQVQRYPEKGLNDILIDVDGSPVTSVAGWQKKTASIRHHVEWALGERPPSVQPNRRDPGAAIAPPPPPSGFGYPHVDDLVRIAQGTDSPSQAGRFCGWLKPQSEMTEMRNVSFGDNLRGDFYYPRVAEGSGRKLPVVIWLHGYNYALGYQWSYRNDLNPILALVSRGYAVFAFDMMGFGTRIYETKHFYDRYPHWSQMGKMVDDTRAAVDALETIGLVDSKRIYVFGYSIGATVAIYTAALDERIQGLVSICGFTPMRLDTADKGTEGLSRYSHFHGFLPRLGFFVGAENRVPYDFHELLAMIAPRPVLVMAPQLDRDATVADVRTGVEQARRVYALYGHAESLGLYSPLDYNRLAASRQEWILAWMSKVLTSK
jgi:dienelactone hydrolase